MNINRSRNDVAPMLAHNLHNYRNAFHFFLLSSHYLHFDIFIPVVSVNHVFLILLHHYSLLVDTSIRCASNAIDIIKRIIYHSFLHNFQWIFSNQVELLGLAEVAVTFHVTFYFNLFLELD